MAQEGTAGGDKRRVWTVGGFLETAWNGERAVGWWPIKKNSDLFWASGSSSLYVATSHEIRGVMKRPRVSLVRRLLAASVVVMGGTAARDALGAAAPTPAQILAVRPVHADTQIDIPQGTQLADLEVVPYRSGRISGWMLRYRDGRLLRFFLDTDGDNRLDQWRFYRNGEEVYRDIDSNRNMRADQHRWYNSGGTKWGIDLNEDGTIDQYRALSLEELLQLLGRAIERRSFTLLRPAIVTPAELAGTFVPPELDASLKRVGANEFASMVQSLRELSGGSLTVERVSQQAPSRIPGPAVDGSMDIVAYRDLEILVRAGNRTQQLLSVPWIVKVGSSWKLASLPGAVHETDSGGHGGGVDVTVERLQPLIERLQAIDRSILQAGDDQARLAALHMQRAGILWEIAQLQGDGEQAELWWKQLVDSTLIAADAGIAGADALLTRVSEALRQDPSRRTLLSYLEYQRIVGSFARKFAQDGTDFVALQKEFVAALEEFVKRHPRAAEAAEALIQIGVSHELLGNPDLARRAFERVRAEFRGTPAAAKAEGALRRLESVGKPFDWALLGLSGTRTARFRGKHVVVYFWAPWCDPCKQELGSIAAMQRNFGSARLDVVAVSLDGDSSSARAFLRSIGGTGWVTLADAEGLEGEYARRFGVFSLPTAFLIDPEGVVIDRNATAAEIRATLERSAARR